MNFQILSHASMAIRAHGKTLLIDPWLVGSCYWRSWWNYPPVNPALLDNLNPDWIYLTHVHWDHFHGATLRKFSKETQILIPYERCPRVHDDLRAMGFRNIRELDHGKTIELTPDLAVTSYQFASPWGDSGLVIETEGVTIFDANDTKFMGSPLEQVINRHKPFDFVMRSHSSANDRICFEYTDTDQEEYFEDPEIYITSFMRFMDKVQPRFAVPFASNHCHLHKDVFNLNDYVMTPMQVKEHIDASGGLKSSELAIMLSGDSWDSVNGFDIAEHTYFSNRQWHIEKYREANDSVLSKTYEQEDQTKLKLKDFERFFGKFFDAVPRMRKRRLKGHPLVFCATTSYSRKYFQIDLYAETILELEERDLTPNSIIYEAPAAILRRAMASNMFSHAGISKRVRYRMRKQDRPYFAQYKQLLAAYEYGVLPLSRLFSWRTFRSYLPRWREIWFDLQVLWLEKRGRSLRDIESEFLT